MPGALSNVIVSSEGRANDRSALATVRALGGAGRRPIVAVSNHGSMAAASRYAAAVVDVGPSDDPRFATTIRDLAVRYDATVIFATSDASLRALNPATNALMNKTTLAAAAAAAGVATPPSVELPSSKELEDLAARLSFPMIVKPKTKRPGGLAAIRVDNLAQLRDAVEDGSIVQPYIEGTTRALSGVMWEGELVVRVQQRYLRTFPPEAGTASAAVTEAANQAWSAALAGLLRDTDGIFQAQFVGSFLIDLNLRPYGSMPLALAAGLNLPDIVCRLTAGEPVPTQRAKLGVHYRWTDGDIRSVVSDVRRGRRSIGSALRALTPRPGTAHSITMIRDPAPGLVRLRRGHVS